MAVHDGCSSTAGRTAGTRDVSATVNAEQLPHPAFVAAASIITAVLCGGFVCAGRAGRLLCSWGDLQTNGRRLARPPGDSRAREVHCCGIQRPRLAPGCVFAACYDMSAESARSELRDNCMWLSLTLLGLLQWLCLWEGGTAQRKRRGWHPQTAASRQPSVGVPITLLVATPVSAGWPRDCDRTLVRELYVHVFA